MLSIKEMILTFSTVTISAIIGLYMIPAILLMSLRARLLDPINERKIHTKTTSRLGGMSFFATICVVILFLISTFQLLGISTTDFPNNFAMEACALFITFMVGLYDDLVGVRYKTKFAFQIAAAAVIVISGTYLKTLNGLFGIHEIPALVGIPMTIVFIIFITNAYNLIDGLDGLAASLAITAFMIYAHLLTQGGLFFDALVVSAALGVLISFLYYNLMGIKKKSSSKIIMGDSGALVIGLILSVMAIKLFNLGGRSITTGLPSDYFHTIAYTMLLVPCFDVVSVVLYRARSKKPLFKPDKNHLHHRFIALGLSHRGSLVAISLINVSLMSINLLLSEFMPITPIMVIDCLLWAAMYYVLIKKIKEASR